MELTQLLEEEFNAWEVPLSKASIDQLKRIDERLDDFRSRLNKRITFMHRTRLETKKAAGLCITKDTYCASRDPNAGCRFESFTRDGEIRYAGSVWFRGERDSFDEEDCEPLPGDLLDASEEVIQQRFAGEADAHRQVLDAQRAKASRDAQAAREAADRADYERLRLKFGGG